MKDTDLRKEFIRIDKTGSGVEVHVCTISWEGSHTPVSKWVRGQELRREASKAEIDKAVALLLEDTQYFRVCRECDERNPIGWMHDERICQGCAERNHGVVY